MNVNIGTVFGATSASSGRCHDCGHAVLSSGDGFLSMCLPSVDDDHKHNDKEDYSAYARSKDIRRH